jgi:hypothetical protein
MLKLVKIYKNILHVRVTEMPGMPGVKEVKPTFIFPNNNRQNRSRLCYTIRFWIEQWHEWQTNNYFITSNLPWLLNDGWNSHKHHIHFHKLTSNFPTSLDWYLMGEVSWTLAKIRIGGLRLVLLSSVSAIVRNEMLAVVVGSNKVRTELVQMNHPRTYGGSEIVKQVTIYT